MAKTSNIVVEVEPREDTGKNACRRIRARGMVPGNVYGLDRPPFMVAIDPKKIEEVLRMGSGVNTIFTLSLAGEQRKRETMIKELQRDPVTERPLHIDFVRIDANKPVHVSVPIRLQGVPTGVKNDGGILDFVHRDVLVECLPGEIPEHLDVDVTALHINQHVSYKDLTVAAGVKVLGDPEEIVAVVVAVKIEEEAPAEVEEVAAEAGAAAEPEVAKKGKEAEAQEKPGDSKS